MKKAGVFVDGANLFYAQKKAGWKIDLSKLKKLLEKEAKILVFNKTPGFYPGRLLLDSLYQKKQVLSRTRKK